MYCGSCGNFNPDGSTFCSNCGASLSRQPSAPNVRQAPAQAYNRAPAPAQQYAQMPAAGSKFTQVRKADGIACGVLGLLLFVIGLVGYFVCINEDPQIEVLTVCLGLAGLGSLFLMLGEILSCLAAAKFNRLNRGIAPGKRFVSAIVGGVLMMVLGIGGIILGIILNNDYQVAMWALFNLGTYELGNGFMGLGGLIIIEGIVIMIVGIVEQSKLSSSNVPPRMY